MWLESIYRPLLAVAMVGILSVDASSQGRGALSRIQVIDSAVIKTPSHRVHSHSEFDLEFVIKDTKQKVKLALEPNHDIIPEGAGVSILGADGEIVSWEPIDRRDHRIFRGSAWIERSQDNWDNIGWSRINIIKDGAEPLFEGSFTIMHDSHHIQLRHKFERTRHENDPSMESAGEGSMILFRDSDTTTHPWHGDLRKREQALMACPADQLDFNSNPMHPVHMSFSSGFEFSMDNATLQRRQSIDGGITSGNAGNVNYASTIGSNQGCPNSRKVALVGVAVDCTYRSLIGTRPETQDHIIAVFNQASQVYEQTFNISLAIRNVTIQEPDCPSTPQSATPWNLGCSDSVSMSQRLNSFSTWRGQWQDVNAYWMLMTNCPSGAEVGLSWLGMLCANSVTSNGNETSTGANVVAHTSSEWQVIAHETGHMFGAVHDCDSSLCASQSAAAQQCCPLSRTSCNANAQFIMNPSTGTNIQTFSACTVGNICNAFLRKSVSNTCLVDNKGVTTVTGQVCGNGIVEEGEECDCGGSSGCVGNTCCNPTTCKFINNAVCDDSNEQCCRGCRFASNGTVCRTSTGVCDPQEVCTGTNAVCPSDTTAPNGQSCGNGLQCASGQCTSRDLQCKSLMGSLTTNNDTYACDGQSCRLLCASPQFPRNQCYSMQQYFLDGTPCGSGTCQNGLCSGSSTLGDIGMVIRDNKTVIIAVCSSVGGLILLCIVVSCIRRRRRRSKRAAYVRKHGSPNNMQQWPTAAGSWGPQQQMPPRYGGSLSQDSPHLMAGPEAHGYFPQQRHQYHAPRTPGAASGGQGPDTIQNGRPPMFYGGHSVRYA